MQKIDIPYKRCVRQLADKSYANGGNSRYVRDIQFCSNARHFIDAYLLIEKDVKKIFEYIEPDDYNNNTYSFKLYEMLVRICIEIEANYKEIFRANQHHITQPTARDYCKIDLSHFLSKYEVKIEQWNGKSIKSPFANWSKIDLLYNKGQKVRSVDIKLPWYSDYNSLKHDRLVEFRLATMENMMSALSGLFVLLCAQFYSIEIVANYSSLIVESYRSDDFENAFGDLLLVRRPTLSAQERYDFDWESLSKKTIRAIDFPYPSTKKLS